MPIPIICLDEQLRQFAERFRQELSKPQYQYLVIVLLGLMLCEGRRTLRGLLRQVADGASLAGLSRFLGQAPWQAAALVEDVRGALYASKVVAYAQGFELMQAASSEYDWKLDLGALARIWRGGCIIRARFLNRITDAYAAQPDLKNLLLAPYFRDAMAQAQDAWRRVIRVAVDSGIPVPAFSSALAYYDGYRRERLPANLVQALRDYFGAHTYRRLDREGSFHTRWSQDGEEVPAG